MAIDIEQVKRRHPIADVVAARGVALHAQGGRLSGRCPFHEDRAPSLVVYPETRSFYCFGCGAGGDVIDFVRRADDVGFREAIDRLGGRPEQPSAPAVRTPAPPRLSLDDRLILSAACELYHETLMRAPEPQRYLRERGVPAWVVRQCRVGYSDGRQLVPYLRRRRLSLKRAEELGLLFARGSETMAGRVVVPELRGAYCGWMVGRALDDRDPRRYRGLSLPRPLLGYERVRGRPRVFLTEGPFDYLTLTGWGLPACALLGTQPGERTLQVLAHVRSIVLVLDSDDAGQQAAARLSAALRGRAHVLELPPDVKDVSALGTERGGRERFFEVLNASERRVRDAQAAAG